MTDQPDDPLLEDGTEEVDFNFDNEKEDALLAETEFDSFVDESASQEKSTSLASVTLNSATAPDRQQLDQEEDVLDIGIVDEDIVESEITSLSNMPKTVEKKNATRNFDSIHTRTADVMEGMGLEQEHSWTLPDSQEIEKGKLHVTTEQNINNEFTIVNNNTLSESCEKKNDEKILVKSNVISLKKCEGKSYDDVPDLDKVIELAQPVAFSRRHRHGKILRNSVRRTRFHGPVKARKREDFIESGQDTRFGKPVVNLESSAVLKKKDAARSSHNRLPGMTDEEQHVGEKHADFCSFVSEFSGISSSQLYPLSDVSVERPILASVRITQERYQIAGDFRYARPSLQRTSEIISCANSQQQNLRPLSTHFEHARSPFYDTNLKMSSTNSSFSCSAPAERLAENDFHSNISRQPFPTSNICYRGPPPSLHLIPPHLTSNVHPPPADYQRFPPPRHYSSSSFPSTSFSSPQHYNQHRPRFLPPVPSFFSQNHPPLAQSQPGLFCAPPPILSANEPAFELSTNSEVQYSSSSAQISRSESVFNPMITPVHHNRSPAFPNSFPVNSPHPNQMISSFAQRMLPDHSTNSSIFQQTRETIRMPPAQNFSTSNDKKGFSGFNNNPNYGSSSSKNFHSHKSSFKNDDERSDYGNRQSYDKRNTDLVRHSQPTECFTKKNLISPSSASYSPLSTACDSNATLQHPIDKVFTHSSDLSASCTDGQFLKDNHLKNSQIEYSRFTKEEHYSNPAHKKYSNRLNDEVSQIDKFISNNRDHTINHSKRIAQCLVDVIPDGSSAKKKHCDYSDDKLEEDMELYRKKIECQKKMREKFVQMKEEQRLKNQMQNFIQNNIKGILQKREQFLQKNELKVNREKLSNFYLNNEEKRNQENVHHGEHTVKKLTDIPLTTEQANKKQSLSSELQNRNTELCRNSVTNFQSTELSEELHFSNRNGGSACTKQLHKLIKIRYKDGTVALKSFPVTNNNQGKSVVLETAIAADTNNLNVTISNKDSEDESPTQNENMIIESVRKGIAQSSMPLALRFSNLKSDGNKFVDEDGKNRAYLHSKSKNRLVISNDD